MKESVSIPEEDVRRKAKEDTADVSRRTLLKFAAGAAINTLLPKAAMDSRTHAEAVLSPEETIATTERLTGMPYAEFSEHFDARVRVPSPRGGPYVIHIRQMHQPAQDPERKIQGQSDVVARQRRRRISSSRSCVPTNSTGYFRRVRREGCRTPLPG